MSDVASGIAGLDLNTAPTGPPPTGPPPTGPPPTGPPPMGRPLTDDEKRSIPRPLLILLEHCGESVDQVRLYRNRRTGKPKLILPPVAQQLVDTDRSNNPGHRVGAIRDEWRKIGMMARVVNTEDPDVNTKEFRVVAVDTTNNRLVIDTTPPGAAPEDVRYTSIPTECSMLFSSSTMSGLALLEATNIDAVLRSAGFDPHNLKSLAPRPHADVQENWAFRDVPRLAPRLGFTCVYGYYVIPVTFPPNFDVTTVLSEVAVVCRQPNGALVDLAHDILGFDEPKLFIEDPLLNVHSLQHIVDVYQTEMYNKGVDVTQLEMKTNVIVPFPEQHYTAYSKALRRGCKTWVDQRRNDGERSLVVTRALAERMMREVVLEDRVLNRRTNGWVDSTTCTLCAARCFAPVPDPTIAALCTFTVVQCPRCPTVYCSETCRGLHAALHKKEGCVSAEEQEIIKRNRQEAKAEVERHIKAYADRVALEEAEKKLADAKRRVEIAKERAAREETEEREREARDSHLAASKQRETSNKKKKKAAAKAAAQALTPQQVAEQAIQAAWASDAERAARTRAFNAKQELAREERLKREAQAEVDLLINAAKEAAKRAAVHAQGAPSRTTVGDFVPA